MTINLFTFEIKCLFGPFGGINFRIGDHNIVEQYVTAHGPEFNSDSVLLSLRRKFTVIEFSFIDHEKYSQSM